MKKVLVAGAALLIAGSMVSAAQAEVKFGGDARFRGITMKDYSPDADSKSKLDSRVRLKVNAKAKGGASVNARIRMTDGMWDGGKGATGNAADPKNIYVDYAYITVPMGPVTLSGGRQVKNFSKWFSWDGRADRLKAVFKTGGTKIVGFYDKNAEITDPVDPEIPGDVSTDWTDDNDKNGYGLVVVQKMGAVKFKAIAVALQDETPVGNDGLVGSVNLAGKAGAVNFEAELAAKDFDKKDDTALGGFATVGSNFGAVSLTGIAGFTKDGYKADDDFGLIMLGGGTGITAVKQIGTGGDTTFFGAIAGFKASDKLSLGANVLYATIDDGPDLVEVSGSAKYAISDGAYAKVVAGMLDNDQADDTAIGAYFEFGVSF